jgi:hypothetical protein
MTQRPSVRETHGAYVASLTDSDLAGVDDGIVDQHADEDFATLRATDTPLHIHFPAPQDLVEVIWEADNSTFATIDNDGRVRSGADATSRRSPIQRSAPAHSQADGGTGGRGPDRWLPPEIWGRSKRGLAST